MIRIGDCEINCDKNQFILKEMRVQQDEKRKSYGKEYCYNETYHGNAEQVVNKLLDLGLKNYIDTSDFGAVLAYMQNVKARVKDIVDLKKKK